MERGYNVAVAGIPKTIDNDGTFVSGILLKFFLISHGSLSPQWTILTILLVSAAPWKPPVIPFAPPRRKQSATFPTCVLATVHSICLSVSNLCASLTDILFVLSH